MSLAHPPSCFDTPWLHVSMMFSRFSLIHTRCLPGVSQSKCWEVCLLGSCSLHCNHHSIEPVLPKRHTTQHLKLRYWRWQLRGYLIYGGMRHSYIFTSSMHVHNMAHIPLTCMCMTTNCTAATATPDVPAQIAFHWICQYLVWIRHRSVLYGYRLMIV